MNSGTLTGTLGMNGPNSPCNFQIARSDCGRKVPQTLSPEAGASAYGNHRQLPPPEVGNHCNQLPLCLELHVLAAKMCALHARIRARIGGLRRRHL
jgi:hypothetical protein